MLPHMHPASREGTLQRFGADILDRLARDKAIPRREAWGEWVMTDEVRSGQLLIV